jgi:lipoic acid synthetase
VRAVHDAGAFCEVLVPDFGGDAARVRGVLESAPEVFAHNVETVPRLYPAARGGRQAGPRARYGRSLFVLEAAAREAPSGTAVKSGLMVGLGERASEVESVLRDLRGAGCSVVTIGQYLSPPSAKAGARGPLLVAEYVRPDVFARYERKARELGFAAVAAGPFVRSSYRAEEMWRLAVAGMETAEGKDVDGLRTA